MRILTIRRGFQADHSSTSYEFFAVDNALTPSQRGSVANLSSRANPTKRRVSFIYHGEWSDLPGGWAPLMEKYYDVVYSESYGWWTLAMAFVLGPKNIKEISRYEFNGTDDMGVAMESKDKRIIVSIHCRLDPGFLFDEGHSNYDYYDDEVDDEDDEVEDGLESGDNLLDLLAQNREYLRKGDYRLLYGIWQIYGADIEDDEEFEEGIPPEPPEMEDMPQPVRELLSLLEE